MSKARVFILENGRFSTDDAERFGERVFAFQSAPSPFSPNEIRERTFEMLEEHAFHPDRDYVAMTGSSVQLAIFFGSICETWDDTPLKLLIFDARHDKYVERVLQ